MVKFDKDKKGYDPTQVDEYIRTLTLKYEEKLAEQKDRVFTLRNEVNVLKERLEGYQDKDRQISKALIFAVEKADQIENSAKKLYDLEIKRVNLLYERWNTIMSEIERTYGANKSATIAPLIEEFKRGLDSILKQNQKITSTNIKTQIKNNSDSYIKNLLNKMDYVINNNSEEMDKPRKLSKVEYKPEHEQKEEKPTKLQSISNRLEQLNSKLGTKHDNLVDAYLDEREHDNNAFARKIGRKQKYEVNDSGFDLQEALNPKEDLDEIMKAFDFFNK